MENSLASLLKENTINTFHKVLWAAMLEYLDKTTYSINWEVVEKLKLKRR